MAMVLVITILAALLGIAAIGLSLQLNSTKSAGLVKSTRSSLYCAEAGLQAARATIVANRATWNDVLATATTNPTWYGAGISGDFDNDGTGGDYLVTIKDDGDDGDPDTDDNDTIVVTSVCTNPALANVAPATVIELISLKGQGHTYRAQSGCGPGNTGNCN